MDAYFLPIGTAAWQFPIIAALLTLPYCVYSYRKYGAVSAYRSVLLFSMLFSAMRFLSRHTAAAQSERGGGNDGTLRGADALQKRV